jgi:hypothetical protein
MKRELLPAVRVYTSAASQGLSISIPEFRTTASLVVQIICEDSNDAALAERIDLYCDIVKGRLLSDADWLQIFERVLAIETEFDRQIEGEWRLTTATPPSASIHRAWSPTSPTGWRRCDQRRRDRPGRRPQHRRAGTPPNVEGGYPAAIPAPMAESKPSSRSSIRNRRRLDAAAGHLTR